MSGTAHLLAYGLRALRRSLYFDNACDPVLAMLSIGVEKLVKISLGLIHLDDHGQWPSRDTFRNDYGHDIQGTEQELRAQLHARAGWATWRQHFDPLLTHVDADSLWPLIVAALDRYAKQGRYYYLDAVAGAKQPDESPAHYWERVDAAAVDTSATLSQLREAAGRPDPRAQDALNQGLNNATADSIGQWWRMNAMAGKQRVLGEASKTIGTDQETIGQQARDDP
ncbi:hypothetical protein Q6346_14665 [Isoptericola sp. b490]|nr:hypothetical protein [Isoptericola sp. b490]